MRRHQAKTNLSLPAKPLDLILWLYIPVLLLTAVVLAAPKSIANIQRPVSISISPLPTSSLPVTTEFTSTAPAVQTTTTDAPPATSGVINTLLQTSGAPTQQPFPSQTNAVPTTSIETNSLPSTLLTTTSLEPTGSKANILAVPIATGPPPSLFVTRNDHPVQPKNISARSGPLQTNKFYGNLLVGDQREPIWPQPYSLWWAKEGNSTPRQGVPNTYGLAISNIERDNLFFGDPIEPGDPPKWFGAPLYVQQMVLSAAELGPDTILSTDSHKQFSVNINLQPNVGAAPIIRSPVVQGMGFVSALYTSATPLLQSNLFFTDLVENGVVNGGSTYKWIIKLKDGTTWLVYMTPNGAAGRPPLVLQDSTTVAGPSGFTGLIQIANNTAEACGEAVYDHAAGTYAISASISASVEGKTGVYTFSWQRGGSQSQSLLMFAQPHHVQSMTPDTLTEITCVNMWTTTKGLARGVIGESWTLQQDDLPTDIGFDPWRNDFGTIRQIASPASNQVTDAASRELAQDMDKLTNLDSAYYGGKALSKFAQIVYAANKLGQNPSLAAIGLQKLEEAFARWIMNQQIWPFAYDPVWGGIVSTASYEGRDQGYDFGNTCYNDHHFHFGYFVHAASIIAYLHPDWLDQGNNKIWVDTLVRDYANADSGDPYFPPNRAFDFFSGHSWATGVFPMADGKNEESTSEDAFSAYAMKMWGHVTGDANMEARGNLQLAIMRNAFSNYFLYEPDNQVQPPAFVQNVNSGILFENKIDHATFFGGQAEFVQGIHMLPISPITPYIRQNSFVAHEWATYFQSSIPPNAAPDPATGIIPAYGSYPGGYNCSSRIGIGRLINCASPDWKGTLMGNIAQVDPTLAWQFFSNANFDWNSLSGSGSRSWYLAYSAAFGGMGSDWGPQQVMQRESRIRSWVKKI